MKAPTRKELLQTVKNFYNADEANKRAILTQLHHIMDYCGWGDLIVTHCSVRLPNTDGDFLIAPYGLMFNEVTPENLIKLDKHGKKKSESEWRANNNGAKSHSDIYAVRPDVNCIIHTHTPNGVAIASVQEDLICTDQMSMMLHGMVSYHDYDSFFTHEGDDAKAKFKKLLDNKKALILRNHGLLVMASTIQEAFWYYRYLELACEIQLKALSTGKKLIDVHHNIKETVAKQSDEWNGPEEDGFPGHADLAFSAMLRKLQYDGYYK